MDVKLQNAYVEVLLDNFMSVIKQNIMFQAQLEVLKGNITEADEVKRKILELSERNAQLQVTVTSLETQVESLSGENDNLKSTVDKKDAQVSSTLTLRQEKDRLQSAVNDYMRQIKMLKEDVLKAKAESQDALVSSTHQIDDLNKYIQRLESVVPANKLKKIKTGDLTQFEQPEKVVEEVHEVQELKVIEEDNVKSGGSF